MTQAPPVEGRRARSTLAARMFALSIGIAVVTALVAGAIAIGLIRSAGDAPAQQTLKRLADVAQSVDITGTRARKLHQALLGLHIRAGTILPNGIVAAQTPLVRQSVSSTDVNDVLSGRSVSTTGVFEGRSVLIEARPSGRGGVVLVQLRSDAVAPTNRAVSQIVIALLAAAVLAAAVGLFVAWRLARPLRRTAAAAHALARGRRDIVVPVEGPVEVAEVSDAVNTLTAALRASERRQQNFLLSVSHDLRTPLTAITGYAESLSDGVVAPEDGARIGTVMVGEAHRLEQLVGDLLDLARLGAEDLRVDLVDLDLCALARDIGRVWSDRCAAADVNFVLELPPQPVPAHTDPSRLRQALDGLFDNALRVTPAGRPIVLAVRLEPHPTGVVAVAEVRDGGPGLRDEDLPVAFEQGVLHERYRGLRQVGTGLGLAIVQRLVQRVGASIEAGHAAEGGARFTVRLPPAAGTTSW